MAGFAALTLVCPAVSRAQQTTASAGLFSRSVPARVATTEPIALPLGEAIGRALETNLGLLVAEQQRTSARGARWLALSALLPQVDARVAETRQVVNLAAFGFPLPAGAAPIVGPFNVFDARLSLAQPVFDLRALQAARAGRHARDAADFGLQSARELVVLVTTDTYLRALAAASRAESVRAQLRTAEALHAQALDLKNAGIVAGIDALRAELQVSIQQQRVSAAQNEADKSRLKLSRVVGLAPGQSFTLATDVPELPSPALTLDEALVRARAARPDYQGALARVRAAEATHRAAVAESLPSVQLTANYGAIGRTASSAERTYAVAGAVTIPVFSGGRRLGHRLAAEAELETRRAEADDLLGAIDFEVRSSFLDVRSSEEQLRVAGQARALADEQLVQARDRLAAGIATSVEVVQAQEAVALANDQYIAALYGANRARAALAWDLGEAEASARRDIGGLR